MRKMYTVAKSELIIIFIFYLMKGGPHPVGIYYRHRHANT